ncbi:beta-catenin binding [Homalodisca vitripennis]|nr:beta-catenin binding [Homalodisca vitripennis]
MSVQAVPVVQYKITSGNVGSVFVVDQDTGVVSLASPLDYESKKQYSLQMLVTDGESVSYATLIIYVQDVNDNPPVFERSSYRTQITEEDDRNLPKKILQVNITDADKDRPRDIVYFLTGPGVDTEEPSGTQFSINSSSGEIYVVKVRVIIHILQG